MWMVVLTHGQDSFYFFSSSFYSVNDERKERSLAYEKGFRECWVGVLLARPGGRGGASLNAGPSASPRNAPFLFSLFFSPACRKEGKRKRSSRIRRNG